MAKLTACKTCSQMVSKEARACPNCGYPVKKWVMLGGTEIPLDASGAIGCGCVLLMLLIPVLLVLLFGCNGSSGTRFDGRNRGQLLTRDTSVKSQKLTPCPVKSQKLTPCPLKMPIGQCACPHPARPDGAGG